MKNHHDVMVSPAQKARLEEVKWQRRSTLDALVSEIIESYAAGKPRPPQESAEDEAVRIRARIDDDVWARAQKRATIEKTSVTSVVRSTIDQLSVP